MAIRGQYEYEILSSHLTTNDRKRVNQILKVQLGNMEHIGPQEVN